MSEREYSAHSGLSHGAIQKARKAGRLVVYSEGSINAATSDVRRADMTDPDQQRRSTGADSWFSGPDAGQYFLDSQLDQASETPRVSAFPLAWNFGRHAVEKEGKGRAVPLATSFQGISQSERSSLKVR